MSGIGQPDTTTGTDGKTYRRPTRAIGQALGVSDGTVRNDLAGAQSYAPETIIGTDGKTYRRRDKEAEGMSVRGIADALGTSKSQVQRDQEASRVPDGTPETILDIRTDQELNGDMKTTNEAYNEAMREGREDQESESDDLLLGSDALVLLTEAAQLLAEAREQSPILWAGHLRALSDLMDEMDITIGLAELRA